MPVITTALERAEEFHLQRALLLYESGKSAFATVHDIEQEPRGRDQAAFTRLRPGRPITTGEVRDALAALTGQAERVCLLPPNVLVASHGILAWHRAAHPAPLWFSMRDGKGKPDRKHPLSRLSGSKFPMPPLLWMVKDKRIYLWAMKEDARPTAKTKLHPTPFWNSYPQTGGVCQGTMAALPENPVPDAAAIARIEAAFFQSNFTHGPIGVKRTPGITTHADLWRHARKARRFPTELLHKPITTLANILK